MLAALRRELLRHEFWAQAHPMTTTPKLTQTPITVNAGGRVRLRSRDDVHSATTGPLPPSLAALSAIIVRNSAGPLGRLCADVLCTFRDFTGGPAGLGELDADSAGKLLGWAVYLRSTIVDSIPGRPLAPLRPACIGGGGYDRKTSSGAWITTGARGPETRVGSLLGRLLRRLDHDRGAGVLIRPAPARAPRPRPARAAG